MRRGWTAAAVATVALAMAGCGGDEPSSLDGPAQAVPGEGVVLYAEALVKPDAGVADGVRTALRKVSRRDDVLDLLISELDDALAEDVGLTYEQDVEPWLGKRAGVFLTGFGDAPDGAVVLDVDDEAAARQALDEARPGFEPDSDGAIIDGRVVIGSRAAVEAARRAARGDSLADAQHYAESLEPLGDDRIGHLWVDAREALEAIPDGLATDAQRRAIAAAEQPYVVAGLEVSGDRIAMEVGGGVELARAAGNLGEGQDTATSPLLGELPSDSWIAVGVAGAGRSIGQGFLQGLRQTGPAGADVIEGIEREAGVDLEADLFSQIDDLAVHVSGTGLTSLGVGALLEASDPGRVLDAIRSLVERGGGGQVVVEPSGDDGFVVRLQAAPFSVQVRRSGDRVAAGLGSEAADRLLEPDEPLEDTEVLERVREDLGEDANVSGFVLFAPMLELMDGLLGDDPGFRRARPYLDAYERVSLGDRKDGDIVLTEIVVRLK